MRLTAGRLALGLVVAASGLAALARWIAGIARGERWRHAAARHRRAREIARTLARHGLGWVAGPGGIGRVLPFHRGLLGHARRDVPYTRPEHLRLALEDLGPTFIKLGQIVSTRGDLLPPDYQAELARLQDQAPPEPWPVVARVLRVELGSQGIDAFADLDPIPIAAASIGQAHAAVLRDGTEVIVKVRRPGVVERITDDLAVIEGLAAIVARRIDRPGHYDINGLVYQFGDTLRAELDYRAEAANARRFAANFATDPMIRIPEVFGSLSTARVLTLERLRGARVDDLDALDAAGIDRHALAVRAATLALQMVYRDGFFHADPHPGNFFIAADGTIGLIDFGMVGTLDENARQSLVRALVALAAGDGDGLVDAFVDLGFAAAEADRAALRDDLAALVHDQLDQPLGEISLAGLLRQAFGVVRHHRLVLPANLALLAKTIAMNEGIGAQLDPGFRLLDALGSFTAADTARPPTPTRSRPSPSMPW